ncbi:hypothetical protein B0H13DRAFT_2376601 [Mycena leptocephala]|nr:hypothetical protein B0H13DRAFT_2376601 [Mycena leptocephala]
MLSLDWDAAPARDGITPRPSASLAPTITYMPTTAPNHLGFKAGGFQAFNIGYRGSAPTRRTA